MGSKVRHSASKRILVLLVSCPFLLPAFAQQPNQWRGLTLHQSTMKDAVAELGRPKKIRENQKFQTVLDEFVDKSKRYAMLEYRRLEKMTGANLYFLGRIAAAVWSPIAELLKGQLGQGCRGD